MPYHISRALDNFWAKRAFTLYFHFSAEFDISKFIFTPNIFYHTLPQGACDVTEVLTTLGWSYSPSLVYTVSPIINLILHMWDRVFGHKHTKDQITRCPQWTFLGRRHKECNSIIKYLYDLPGFPLQIYCLDHFWWQHDPLSPPLPSLCPSPLYTCTTSQGSPLRSIVSTISDDIMMPCPSFSSSWLDTINT